MVRFAELTPEGEEAVFGKIYVNKDVVNDQHMITVTVEAGPKV